LFGASNRRISQESRRGGEVTLTAGTPEAGSNVSPSEVSMAQPRNSTYQFCLILLAALLLLSTSCGGGKSSSSTETISSAQAQAVSQQVVTTLQGALSSTLSSLSATPSAHPSLAKTISEAHPDMSSSDCTSSSSGESCDIPVSYSGTCPGGGSIEVSGNFDFSLNSSGDGSNNFTLTITPANCSVSNLTINGNPDITLATKLTFQNDAPEFPITLTEGGGITYGPNPSGSCSTNVTITVSSSLSCSVSGSVCGQSVAGSC
jgi:hypothetical protein